MYDTLIIGAGMSGLAAGIRLAHYDQRVCILERHTTIGGLNSFYRLGGRNYDVGLHAVTNYAPKGSRSGPLAKLLRQLRFTWDEFALVPQLGSRIVFPGATLDFTNDIEFLFAEIRRQFPRQIDRFRQLIASMVDYDELDLAKSLQSARTVISEIVTDPLLVEMLLCPIMFYGGARQRDIDFGQFSILFRSIFLEGLARPFAGIRLILKKLVQRFKSLGGELRLRSGVRRISVQQGHAAAVELDDGTLLQARNVLSSAGWLETMRLCDDVSDSAAREPGDLSFVESISVLDRTPRDLGFDRTVVFYNDTPEFHWEKPADCADLRSGVICSPNNFSYDQPLEDSMLRITSLANFDAWQNLPEAEYRLAKLDWYDRMLESACRFIPDFRRGVIETDMFTPTTIRRFTGHINGAIYGAPHKQYDGRTHLENLYICGTDQGLVGIVGALISGITIANRYLLNPTSMSPTPLS
jgi:phytoene dehydrogenase-like protein